MGKFKPHKGLLKRVRITKSGKIKGRVANGSHLRSGKTGRQMRHLAQARYITNYGVMKRISRLLGMPLRQKTRRRVNPATTLASSDNAQS